MNFKKLPFFTVIRFSREQSYLLSSLITPIHSSYLNMAALTDSALLFDMESPMEYTPEVDCDRTIGKDHYTFYFPIEVSSFVVSIWTRSFCPGQEYFGMIPVDVRLAVSIFEHGSQISARDPRFKAQSWFKKLQTSWSEEVFTRSEVDEIVTFLLKLTNYGKSSSAPSSPVSSRSPSPTPQLNSTSTTPQSTSPSRFPSFPSFPWGPRRANSF